MANVEVFNNSSNSSVKVPYFSIAFGDFNLTPVPPKYINSVSVERYEDDNAGKFTISLTMPLSTFEKNSVSPTANFTTVLSTMIATSQDFDEDIAKMTFYYGWQHGAGCIVKDAVISTFNYGISLSSDRTQLISYEIGGTAAKVTNRMFEKHFYTIPDASAVLEEINKLEDIVESYSDFVKEPIADTGVILDEKAKNQLNTILNNPVNRLNYPNGFSVTFKNSSQDTSDNSFTYWIITASDNSGIQVTYNNSSYFVSYNDIPENVNPTYDNLGRVVIQSQSDKILDSITSNTNYLINPSQVETVNLSQDSLKSSEEFNFDWIIANGTAATILDNAVTTTGAMYSKSQRALFTASYGTSFRISYFVERLAKYLYGDVYTNIDVEHSDKLYDVNEDFDDIYNIVLDIKNIDKSNTTLKELLDKLVSLCYVEETQENAEPTRAYYEMKFDYTHNGGTVWIGVNNIKDLDPKVYIISNNYKTKDVISFQVSSNGLPGYAAIKKVLNTSNAGVEASSGLCFVTKTDTGGKVPLDRADADTMPRAFLSKIAYNISQNTSEANLKLFGSNDTINTTIGKTTIRIMPLINNGDTLWCGDYIVKGIKDTVNESGFRTEFTLMFDQSVFYDEVLAAYDGTNGVNTGGVGGTAVSQSETGQNSSELDKKNNRYTFTQPTTVSSNVVDNVSVISSSTGGIAYDAGTVNTILLQLKELLGWN